MGNVISSSLVVALGSTLAVAGVTRSVDFESGGVTNGSVRSVGGLAGLGAAGREFSGSMLRVDSRDPAGVYFDGLGAHGTIELSFALAVIDSWDGEAPGRGYAPDFIGVRIDGVEVFRESFTNFPPNTHGNPTWNASFDPNERIAFGKFFGTGGWNDSVYDITISGIEHTADTATVEFFAAGSGFQGGMDESFAVDAVSIATIPSPSPAVIAAFAGLMVSRRRR